MHCFLVLFYTNMALFSANFLLLIETVYQLLPCTEKGPKRFEPPPRTIANRETTPYIAAILVQEEIEEDYDLICASVIVSLYFALTTAHCIDVVSDYQEKYLRVRSGSIDWRKGGILHDVIFTVRHEGYDRGRMKNDMGVISVEPHFLNDAVETVAVAGPRYEFPAEPSVNVTGWGSKGDGGLHTVTMSVLDRTVCEGQLKGSNNDGERVHLEKSQFCARTTSGNDDGASVYDPGCPAIRDRVLVGLVSSCGTGNLPGLFTDARSLYLWLARMSYRLNMQISFVPDVVAVAMSSP